MSDAHVGSMGLNGATRLGAYPYSVYCTVRVCCHEGAARLDRLVFFADPLAISGCSQTPSPTHKNRKAQGNLSRGFVFRSLLELWDRQPPQLGRDGPIFDHYSLKPEDFLDTVNAILGDTAFPPIGTVTAMAAPEGSEAVTGCDTNLTGGAGAGDVGVALTSVRRRRSVRRVRSLRQSLWYLRNPRCRVDRPSRPEA